MNQRLVSHVLQNQFVTAFCASLEPASGRLSYSSAGHDPPIVRRAATGDIETLGDAQGVPLGLFENAEYDLASFELAPGDTLLLYTDGLPDAVDPDGRFFGAGRIRTALAGSEHADAEGIARSLLREAVVHMAGTPATDDVTFVVVRRSDIDPPMPSG